MQTNPEVEKKWWKVKALFSNHKISVEPFRLNEKAASETLGYTLTAFSDPSIHFVCTALDQGKLVLKHSKLFTIGITRSYPQLNCLHHADTNEWPVSVLLTDTSILQLFQSSALHQDLQASQVHAPSSWVKCLWLSGSYSCFTVMDTKDFIALSTVISLHTQFKMSLATEYHFLCLTMLSYKQSDHVINIFFSSPTHWFLKIQLS